MKIKDIDIFASCNPTPHCLEKIDHHLIFSCESTLFIFDIHTSKITLKITPAHPHKIAYIKHITIPNIPPNLHFTSTAQNQIKIWSLSGKLTTSFVIPDTLLPPNTEISSIESFTSPTNTLNLLLSAHHSVFHYEHRDSKWVLRQKLDFPNQILTVSVAKYPQKGIIFLAAAGVDSVLRLFAKKAANFEEVKAMREHRDWIKSVAFRKTSRSANLMFVSVSQDAKVILWEITQNIPAEGSLAFYKVAKNVFRVGGAVFCCQRKAVFRTHSKTVCSVEWSRESSSGGFITASMDGTVRLFKGENNYDEDSEELGDWEERLCIQDEKKKKRGFLRAIWDEKNGDVFACSKTGRLNHWKVDAEAENFSDSENFSVAGHVGAVNCVKWDKNFDLLFSAGNDKTVKIYKKARGSYRHICIAQNHGYSINKVLPLDNPLFTYISSADECSIRIYSAPASFLKFFGETVKSRLAEDDIVRAEYAINSEMNLCNKAIYKNEEGVLSEDKGLWQEAHKLFVAKDNVTAIAECRGLIAVASECCRLSKQSEIEFWKKKERFEWSKSTSSLVCHRLEVTALEFSEDGTFLLSASRDRTFCLFKRGGDFVYAKFASGGKAHNRSITDCEWLSSNQFCTCSLDKKLKTWLIEGNEVKIAQTIKFESPLNCVSYCYNKSLLSIGFRNGQIKFFSLNGLTLSELTISNSQNLSYCSAIKSLDWSEREEETAKLAIGGEDGVVTIANIEIK